MGLIRRTWAETPVLGRLLYDDDRPYCEVEANGTFVPLDARCAESTEKVLSLTFFLADGFRR